MGNVGRLLERGFLGGVVFVAACAGFVGACYLLYRLIRLTRPKEVRQEERQMLSHRLYPVSGRGRIAYLILCLEEALRFYGQDLYAWEWILRRLWSITDCSEENWIDIWLDAVGALLPSDVLAGSTGEAVPEEMSKARALYAQAGTAMVVITAVLENAYRIVGQWAPDTVAHDPDGLCLIDKAEETMRAFGVPLPSNETIQPLLAQKDSALGKPFDGARLSCLSRQGR